MSSSWVPLPQAGAAVRPGQRVRAIDTPIIPELAGLARTHGDSVSLGQGVAFFGPPPEVSEALSTFWGSFNPHGYGPAAGDPELIELIEAKLTRENGFEGSGKGWRVMVTAGANMAFLNAILAITDPGDEVILPLPWYFNHEMAVRLAGAVPVGVPCGPDFVPDLDRIVQAINPRTRAIVTVSPNNPTGVVYPEATLTGVNALAAQRGLWHVSDETYEYFLYGAARHVSPGAPGHRHTLTIGSLSKAYGMAGWRIGYLLCPADLYPELIKIQDTNLICPTQVAQHGAKAALRHGAAWCRTHLADLLERQHEARRKLALLGEHVRVHGGAGALYLYLEIAGSSDSLALARHLVADHGVTLLPGSAFGDADACRLRLAYGALDSATLERGLDRLVAALSAALA